jgi:ABC-type cobalamin/Fe3+-siderophores transport system ATPase subunit
MVIATHDLEFAVALCTRHVLLEGGRIAYDGADAADVAQRL